MRFFWWLWDAVAIAGTFSLAIPVSFYMARAYSHGNTKILLDFDVIGEAQFEVIAFPIACGMILVTWVRHLRSLFRRR
ncbi:hypothetical protein LCGC14_2320580 [marine sediment metagenome]|uniref:Uncharacterized protein n=1 Tax=marine sediment metagenome TaxID=412755 RepID=A0A0F9D5G0_9ZZZZ